MHAKALVSTDGNGLNCTAAEALRVCEIGFEAVGNAHWLSEARAEFARCFLFLTATNATRPTANTYFPTMLDGCS